MGTVVEQLLGVIDGLSARLVAAEETIASQDRAVAEWRASARHWEEQIEAAERERDATATYKGKTYRLEARYEIRRMGSKTGTEGIEATAVLRDEHEGQRWHDDPDTALIAVKELADEYHYGVVLVDHEDRTIDWGDRFSDFAGRALDGSEDEERVPVWGMCQREED